MKLTIGDRSISFSEDAVKKYKKNKFIEVFSKRHKIAEESILKEELAAFYDLINPPKKGKKESEGVG